MQLQLQLPLPLPLTAMAAAADVVDVDDAAADNGICKKNMAEARLAASQNKQAAAKMLMSLYVINFHITHTLANKQREREREIVKI